MRQLNSFMYLEKDYLSHTHWGNYTHPYWMWYLELIRLIVKDVKLNPMTSMENGYETMIFKISLCKTIKKRIDNVKNEDC